MMDWAYIRHILGGIGIGCAVFWLWLVVDFLHEIDKESKGG